MLRGESTFNCYMGSKLKSTFVLNILAKLSEIYYAFTYTFLTYASPKTACVEAFTTTRFAFDSLLCRYALFWFELIFKDVFNYFNFSNRKRDRDLSILVCEREERKKERKKERKRERKGVCV